MNKMIFCAGMLLGVAAGAWGAAGTAEVMGTAPKSPISGIVRFEDTSGGLKLSAVFSNVPVGPHAFHIHEFGSCADLGKAAGSHYNPMSAPHGQILKDGLHHAHAGDLGNLVVGKDGKAALEAVIPGVTLTGGAYTVAGRAVILHEKVDDFSQPVGNAGGRIACGAILLTGSPTPAAVTPPAK